MRWSKNDTRAIFYKKSVRCLGALKYSTGKVELAMHAMVPLAAEGNIELWGAHRHCDKTSFFIFLLFIPPLSKSVEALLVPPGL